MLSFMTFYVVVGYMYSPVRILQSLKPSIVKGEATLRLEYLSIYLSELKSHRNILKVLDVTKFMVIKFICIAFSHALTFQIAINIKPFIVLTSVLQENGRREAFVVIVHLFICILSSSSPCGCVKIAETQPHFA